MHHDPLAHNTPCPPGEQEAEEAKPEPRQGHKQGEQRHSSHGERDPIVNLHRARDRGDLWGHRHASMDHDPLDEEDSPPGGEEECEDAEPERPFRQLVERLLERPLRSRGRHVGRPAAAMLAAATAARPTQRGRRFGNGDSDLLSRRRESPEAMAQSGVVLGEAGRARRCAQHDAGAQRRRSELPLPIGEQEAVKGGIEGEVGR